MMMYQISNGRQHLPYKCIGIVSWVSAHTGQNHELRFSTHGHLPGTLRYDLNCQLSVIFFSIDIDDHSTYICKYLEDVNPTNQTKLGEILGLKKSRLDKMKDIPGKENCFFIHTCTNNIFC